MMQVSGPVEESSTVSNNILSFLMFFIVVGGRDNSGECLNEGEVYDPETDK